MGAKRGGGISGPPTLLGLYTPRHLRSYGASGGSHGTSRRASRRTRWTIDGADAASAADAGWWRWWDEPGAHRAHARRARDAGQPWRARRRADANELCPARRRSRRPARAGAGRCGRRAWRHGRWPRWVARADATVGLRRSGRLLGEPRRQQADRAGRHEPDLRTRGARADLAAGGDQRGRRGSRPVPASARGRRSHDARRRCAGRRPAGQQRRRLLAAPRPLLSRTATSSGGAATPSPARGPSKLRLRIRPLTPDLWPALEDLFGRRGACNGCWCMYWRIGSAYRRRPARANKQAFRNVVKHGPPPGLLAFAGDLAIGWCQLTPRDALPWLDRTWRLAPVDARPVWSISCFYVRKGYRRRGITAALIAAALQAARRA